MPKSYFIIFLGTVWSCGAKFMGEYHQVLPAADELLKDAEGRAASADVMYLSRNSKSCFDCKLSCVPVGS